MSSRNWTVKLTSQAEKDLKFWHKNNRKVYEKCVEILRQLEADPINLQTTGKPEWLKGNLAGHMSRRITRVDRCVYEVIKDQKIIKVLQLQFHYED